MEEASKAQPKYHASQIAVNEPEAHTRVFLFHFLFKRKKKNSQRKKKETEWKTHIDSSYPETQLWDFSIYVAAWNIGKFSVCVMPPNRKYGQQSFQTMESFQTKKNISTYDQFP